MTRHFRIVKSQNVSGCFVFFLEQDGLSTACYFCIRARRPPFFELWRQPSTALQLPVPHGSWRHVRFGRCGDRFFFFCSKINHRLLASCISLEDHMATERRCVAIESTSRWRNSLINSPSLQVCASFLTKSALAPIDTSKGPVHRTRRRIFLY